MTALERIRAMLMTVAVALAAGPAALPAQAQEQSATHMDVVGDPVGSTPISLGVNKSVVIELPRPAGDVLVSNPAIADAVLRTSRRLYLIGVKLGQANVFLFDQAGDQIASFDVYVEADLSSLNELLAEAIPDGYVRAQAMNGNIVLRGQVPSASDASRAQEITVGMLDGFSAGTDDAGAGGGASGGGDDSEKNVVNLITITGEDQVALKVTIAEVRREVVKQLGINLQAELAVGDFGFGADLNPLQGSASATSDVSSIGFGVSGSNGSLQANVQALEETKMIKTLAEPTLTAVSGETAEFLAGGEFPFITGIDEDNGTRTVDFKPFGVQLAFTPVVLSSGRISLKVRTEVSEIASLNSGIPTLDTRRAETTVELPSGGAFAIGGLVQENSRRAATGVPGLQRIPILGALFASKSFVESETELVMIVTAYLVKPAAPQALGRPDENLMMTGDAETFFMNRLAKVYGTAKHVPARASSGPVGFTFD
jgi:pilus assembly protein CpaC